MEVNLVAPDKIVFSAKDISMVSVPGIEGNMGIMDKHIPIITFLRPGIIKVEGKEKNNFFVISGVIDFKDNKLNILSDSIYETNKIDSKKLTELKEEAINKINKNKLNDQDVYLTSTLINELDNFNFR
ncbi:MAG: ATP synthase F1 subunit epsilon [Candidatus Pelagibacter sp.]|nr:ATP synthase F1 subunit epsilon [Candidatus Pelagibacter sp.]OUV97371.1 MAG: ATP synthase F1 subunit epsilon [Candidatus Pelagibacter sp. TMED142]|tara:strand:- start:356 stop:739 length:384 start_codon:yes stop_codon:yes gene_type:complete